MLNTMANNDPQDAVAMRGACFQRGVWEQVLMIWMNCLDLEA
jgi:hypothetical protein